MLKICSFSFYSELRALGISFFYFNAHPFANIFQYFTRCYAFWLLRNFGLHFSPLHLPIRTLKTEGSAKYWNSHFFFRSFIPWRLTTHIRMLLVILCSQSESQSQSQSIWAHIDVRSMYLMHILHIWIFFVRTTEKSRIFSSSIFIFQESVHVVENCNVNNASKTCK